MVFVGPYEHHSNELPWRESIADVVVIAEDGDGHIDVADLGRQLARFAGRPLRIGSFSAASNVTGILTDTDAVARLLHAHGALSFWDYAAAGPYVPIRVAPSAPGAGDHKDAVFLSPHKFPGGPQTPGVLVVRRDLVRNSVPTVPGGGTVAFVDPIGHRYLDDPVAREEGGTPAIVESIRAGLVFALKEAIGTDLIATREEQLWQCVLRRWAAHPKIEILGNQRSRRLAVVSFRVRHGDAQYLHHNFVVALLNDLFGIQARGGCSCAGPYGHRLLAIGEARSHALREEIGHGCDGVKPGWTRINLNYFISAATADYITDAVELVATEGYRLLPEYRFDPHTGLWRHAYAAPQAPLRLSAVGYGRRGEMTYPRTRAQASEDAFPGYLRQARALLAARPARLDEGPTGLDADFEALRWFPLPPACLAWARRPDAVVPRTAATCPPVPGRRSAAPLCRPVTATRSRSAGSAGSARRAGRGTGGGPSQHVVPLPPGVGRRVERQAKPDGHSQHGNDRNDDRHQARSRHDRTSSQDLSSSSQRAPRPVTRDDVPGYPGLSALAAAQPRNGQHGWVAPHRLIPLWVL